MHGVLAEQALGDEGVRQPPPAVGGEFLADAVGGEFFMPAAQHGLVARAAQHLDDVLHPEHLAGAQDAGEEFLRRQGDILAPGGLAPGRRLARGRGVCGQAVVAHAAGGCGKRLAEVGQQGPPPAVAGVDVAQQGIEAGAGAGLL